MKHVANVFGLFLLLLGFAMATDTAWGWAAIAYMNWQIAVISISAYLLFSIVKAVIVHQRSPISKRYPTKKKSRTLGLSLDIKEDLYCIGD